MSRRLIELAERRARLVERIAAQRGDLAAGLAPVKRLLGVADKGVEAVRWMKRHPAVLAGAVALSVALRPRSAFTWLKRGWTAWRLVRRLRARLSGA